MIEKLKFILTKSEKKKLTALFIGTLFLALLEMFSVGIVIPIMALFINPEKIQTSRILHSFYQLTGVRDNIAFLVILIVCATVLFVSKSLYSVLILYKERRIVNDIQIRLTTRLLASYLNKPYSFHLENNTAILFRNVHTTVSEFTGSFLFSLVLISAEIIILLAISFLLIIIYPIVTLLLGSVLAAIIMFINIFIKKRIALYSSERLQAGAELNKFGLEALQAVKEIKVYNAQSFFVERYSQAAKKQADNHVKFNIASVLPRHILEAVLWGTVFGTLLVGIYLSKNPIALIPVMTALGVAALRAFPSVHRIYTYVNFVKYFSNTVDIIYDALEEDTRRLLLEKDVSVSDTGTLQGARDIRLENMEFRYRSAPCSIFKGFNFVIPKHKTVAFAGETGAGKSTLVDILMGLLIPIDGCLFYGQALITPMNILEYRRKIGYVPQNIFLIDDTLESNIAFGVPADSIDHRQLKDVIRISQLDSMVNDLPEGIKTSVGERGARLSGGQRQRIAIARALYHNPEILIMDEATSALDGHTEAGVNEALKNLEGKLTVIIIAHRLSTIEYADTIYVMDRGKIVDQGNFKELLENSPTFKKIANKAPK